MRPDRSVRVDPSDAGLPPTAQDAVKATSRLLRAGWHPIQIEALTILSDHVASPKEVAVELKLTAAKAGYVSGHIKELERRGLVELVRTEPRRGATEHFYKAIHPLIVLDKDAERMSFEERLILSCWIISRMTVDFVMAVETGAIDERSDRQCSRFSLRLDDQGYGDLIDDSARAFHRTLEIRTESEDRLAASGKKGMPFSAMLACFPMPQLPLTSSLRAQSEAQLAEPGEGKDRPISTPSTLLPRLRLSRRLLK